MIFEAFRRLKQAGVLGMNGRNADISCAAIAIIFL
jgi:hypothetical protein